MRPVFSADGRGQASCEPGAAEVERGGMVARPEGGPLGHEARLPLPACDVDRGQRGANGMDLPLERELAHGDVCTEVDGLIECCREDRERDRKVIGGTHLRDVGG